MSSDASTAPMRDALIIVLVGTTLALQLAACMAIGLLVALVLPVLLAGREFPPATLPPAVSLTLEDAAESSDIEDLRAALDRDPRVLEVVEFAPEDNIALLRERVSPDAGSELTYATRSLHVIVPSDADADDVHREIINGEITETSGTVAAATIQYAWKLSLWERLSMGPE